MLAGRVGARLSQALTARVSRPTLLWLIRRLPEPELTTPRVLGVDEFALRKGHNYGTILIDIETRQPIDLLPDRTTSTVARWLTDHPGVEVICRDCSTAYAEAGRIGAPEAVHVADRWHIWSNLAEAVEKTVVQHRALLREPHDPAAPRSRRPWRRWSSNRSPQRNRGQPVGYPTGSGNSTQPSAPSSTRELGCERSAVSSDWPATPSAASPTQRARTSSWSGSGPAAPASSTPTKPYLHQRWDEGCTVARRLFEEVRQRGYSGGESVVKKYVHRLRESFPLDPPPQGTVRARRNRLAHPPPGRLTDDQVQRLKEILACCARPHRPPRPRVCRAHERPSGAHPGPVDHARPVRRPSRPAHLRHRPSARTSTPSSPASASATAPAPKATTTR
ncbi:transposase [Streptomyces sp. NPDC058249]|uniref:transposase n=1 Tax=Streptomyces sp. NPDC058249 TaxID=3346403 RepID=UPI0036E3012A